MDGFQLPQRAKDLVSGGVISVDVHFAMTGIDVWARCIQPHPRLGVYPHESYRVEEILKLLTKIEVPSANAPEKSHPGRSAIPVGTWPSSPPRYFNSIKQGIQYVNTEGGAKVKRGSVENALPSDSLTFDDFERGSQMMTARCMAVADKIGEPRIVSRIATDLRLKIKGVSDLTSWWGEATSDQKFLLLTLNKKVGSPTHVSTYPMGLSPKLQGRLGAAQCPFRVIGASLGSPKEEDENSHPPSEASEGEGGRF